MKTASVETLIDVKPKANYILNVIYGEYAEGQALTLTDICIDINYNLKEKGKTHKCDKEEISTVLEFLVVTGKLKKRNKKEPIVVPGNGKLDYYTVSAYYKT